MNYNISSKNLEHPLLKPILEKLVAYFADSNIQFYVIGATARDIIMKAHNEKAGRASHDLDIAIAISNWKEYQKVEDGIQKIEGFTKDIKQKQRFLYQNQNGSLSTAESAANRSKIGNPGQNPTLETEAHLHTEKLGIYTG